MLEATNNVHFYMSGNSVIKRLSLRLSFLLCLLPVALFAQTPEPVFVTLGTASGPIAMADRAQPANAVMFGNDVYLVDAGDGANGQLAKAGIEPSSLKGMFISHLHFDHTGGVLGVISLRAQLNTAAPFTVYGPPGTQIFIDRLLAAMEPGLKAGFGMPGQSWQTHLTVQELRDGDVVQLQGLTVTIAENNHYESIEDTGDTPGYISLSFRFDSPDRSIFFTGDTGLSEAVMNLARNADILVSEMMDTDVVMQGMGFPGPGAGQRAQSPLEQHLRTHHMSPEEVAEMAAAAEVSELVITHFAPGISSPEQEQYYRSLMDSIYKGKITFANDLERF